MQNLRNLFLVSFVLIMSNINAQTSTTWNGKSCAVVLTYDDALNVHLDNVIPCLDSCGFKGTFYVTGEAPTLYNRLNDWRNAAANGHELGNHTMFHPCDGQLPGRSWVSAEKDLSKYTPDRAISEIKAMEAFLQAIDGKKIRTFAYPCGDMLVDSVNFYDSVQTLFAGARGVWDGMQTINEVDLKNIRCYGINGQSAEYMIDLVKKAQQTHTLLVFLFHGVGGEHSINVSNQAHSQLIQYLKQNEKEIWVAPLVDVAAFVNKKQAK